MNNSIKSCKCPSSMCSCRTPLFIKLENLLGFFEDDQEMRTFTSANKSTALATTNDKKVRIEIEKKSNVTPIRSVEGPKLTAKTTSTSYYEDDDSYYGRHTPTEKKAVVSDAPDADGIIRPGHKIKSHDPVVRCKIPQDVSLVSFTSPSGNYTEHYLTYYLDNKGFASNDKFRYGINLMYDQALDLWKITGRMIKRSYYLGKDDEDSANATMRLCLTSEISQEIKRMLIWNGIDAIACYRQFRKMLIQQKMIYSLSEFGMRVARNERYDEIKKNLDKTTAYSGSTYDHYSGGHHRRDHSSQAARVAAAANDCSTSLP